MNDRCSLRRKRSSTTRLICSGGSRLVAVGIPSRASSSRTVVPSARVSRRNRRISPRSASVRFWITAVDGSQDAVGPSFHWICQGVVGDVASAVAKRVSNRSIRSWNAAPDWVRNACTVGPLPAAVQVFCQSLCATPHGAEAAAPEVPSSSFHPIGDSPR